MRLSAAIDHKDFIKGILKDNHLINARNNNEKIITLNTFFVRFSK